MKRIFVYLPVLFAMLWSPRFAAAQSTFDINMGFGYVHDKSLGNVNSDFSSQFFGEPCTSGSATCATTPALNTFMLGFGGALMAWKHFGVGAEIKFRPTRQDYLLLLASPTERDTLQDRVTLWGVDGILRPITSKRADLRISGGIGGANVKFYVKSASSSNLLGNQNFTQFFGSSNHFQVHGGFGPQLYLTEHVFIRPQFDIHYVHNFTQFGKNTVIGGTIWIGYSLGDRQ